MNRILVSLLVIETAVLVCLAWLVAVDGTPKAIAGSTAGTDTGPASTSTLRHDAARRAGNEKMAPALERQLAPSPNRDELLLFGCIIDRAGQPIRDASIYIWSKDSRTSVGVSEQEGGEYSAFALTPGNWTLRVNARGYKKHSRTIVVTAGLNERRLDITLEPGTLVQIHVHTPEGVPLEKAIRDAKLNWRTTPGIVAMRTELPEAFPLRNTAGNSGIGVGEWRPASWEGKRLDYPADWLGELEIDAEPPIHVGLVLRQIVLQSQILSHGQTKMVFELSLDEIRSKMGSVRVKVVSADTGAPLSDAHVGFNDAQSGGGGFSVDGEGVIVREMPPGIWEFEIRAKDHEHYYRLVRLEPGQKLDLGRLALDKAQILKGVVVGPDGKPAQASVRWDSLDHRSPAQGLRNRMSTSCNAEGEFSIWRIGSGRYAVHAFLGRSGVEGVAHMLVDTRGGAPQDLRIQLQKPIQVRVTNQMPATEIYSFLIQTKAGLPVFSSNIHRSTDFSVWLPVGEFTGEIYRGTKLLRHIPLRVTKDGATLRLR